jgi:uncharacterized protein DUF6263
MSSRVAFLTAGVVALGLLCGPPLSAFHQDLTLRYRWTKGETIRYRITQQSATTISGLPGMGEMNIEQSNVQIFRSVVQDVAADGTTTLQQAVESVKMEMTSPMINMAYDSANPDTTGNPMNAMLKNMFSALIGESFTLVVAPTGEVKKVEGVSKIAEKMFKNMPDDQATAGLVNGLKANLSDEATKSMFTQAFAQFPDRPLKSGDTWKNQFDTGNPMLGGLTTSVTSTLKAVEGDGSARTATIMTSLVMKQDPTKPAPPNPTGFSMQVGDSAGDGEHIFEAVSGRLRRSTTRVSMPMTMSGAGPDGSPLTMKTTVKSTTTVELVQP